jgi:hypothetical protein
VRRGSWVESRCERVDTWASPNTDICISAGACVITHGRAKKFMTRTVDTTLLGRSVQRV